MASSQADGKAPEDAPVFPIQDRAPAERLRFEDDPGSGRSVWVALAVVIALVGWMASGFLFPGAPDVPQAAEPVIRPVTVAVRESAAERVQEFFVAEGQAQAERDTVIRSQATGEVNEVLVSRGADVIAGQPIARIALAEREAALRRAQEEVARAQRELNNAETLLDRGVSTVDRVAQARAALAGAEAELSRAEEAVEDTVLRAPFDGRLETLDLETGEFVSAGAEVGRVVDLTPLSVEVRVPQQSLSSLEVGQTAEVAFITGETRTGTVTFVGTSADPATRTFEAEIEVANDDRTIPAGVSAQVRVPTGENLAHFVSPAILSLDTSGTLGVKTVDDDNVVRFYDVAIVRAQTDGVWVAGLPDEVRIVTVGQGFVNDGERVDPRGEDALDLPTLRQERPELAEVESEAEPWAD